MLKSRLNNLPLISIVIPSFNKGKYIKRTLESIVAQKYPNLEVVIQDGCSDDQSIDIIKKFASRFNYIKWESKKDGGQLDAINKGIHKLHGDILTFINADDVYEVGAFKKIAKAFSENSNALWLAGRGKVIDEYGNEIVRLVSWCKNLLLKVNNYQLLLVVNYLYQPSVFITKKAYQDYGPFGGSSRFVMEYELWLKIGKKKMPYVLNHNISSFRLIKEGMSSSNSKEILNADYEIAAKHCQNRVILFLHVIINKGRIILNKLF